jgi:nucleoid DNA-binding protein
MRDIVKEICKRTKIHKSHISNVIAIMVDEIVSDIKDGKTIRIDNLFSFLLKKSKPRKYHNVIEDVMRISSGKLYIKIKLQNKIKKIIKEAYQLSLLKK